MLWRRARSTKADDRELSVPDGAGDESSVEVLRVWEHSGDVQCILSVGGLDLRDRSDPAAAWGSALADLMNEIGASLAARRQISTSDVMSRIRQGFEAEIQEDREDVDGWFLNS